MRHRIKVKVLSRRHNPKRARRNKRSHRKVARRRTRRTRSRSRFSLMRSNPRRARRSRTRSRTRSRSRSRKVVAHRRNGGGRFSIKSVLSLKNITRILSMGAGFLVGNQVSNFLSTGAFFMYTPTTRPAWLDTIAPARPFFGLAHILLGGFLAVKLKKPMAKDAALGIAIAGGVDIVGQVVGYLSPASTQGMDVGPGGMPYTMGSSPYGNYPVSDSNPMLESASMMGMDMPASMAGM